MCNLSKGVEEQGIQKGLEQGLEQGIQKGLEQGLEQGIQKGLEQGLEQGIRAMTDTLKKLQIPTEIILAEICEKFRLTREEAEKYLKQ